MSENPASLIHETSRCSRCGACLAVCPVYGITLDECLAPRGKVALAEAEQDGLLVKSPRLKEAFGACLLCGACEAACPGRVGGADSVLEERARLKNSGLVKLLSLGFKAGRPFMDLAARSGSFAQELLKKGAEPGSGLLIRVSNLKGEGERCFPKLAKSPFLSGKGRGKSGPGTGEAKEKVAFFVGCGLNYLFPKAASSAVKLLNWAGVEVEVPEDQRCCGMLIHAAGDPEAAKWLARRNIAAIEETGADTVVTGCATCSSFANRKYPELLEGADLPGMVDVTSFLAGLGSLPGVETEKEIPLIYHDPCHLKLSQGVVQEPRSLLSRFGYRAIEIPGETFCCGFGGTLNITHHDLSQKILNERMDAVAEVAKDAAGIATGCPGCLIQLGEGVWHTGLNLPVRHTVEWIAEAVFSDKCT